MSKIGKKPIAIPSGVTVTPEKKQVVVKGPQGQLSAPLFRGIKVEIKDDQVQVSREKDTKQLRSYHGLVRSLIQNHIQGVTDGYQKVLKLVGTGYRAKQKGAGLELAVGYSHPVEVGVVEGVKLELEGDDTIKVTGIDKQKVGQVAADIRAIRPPEPYKGKGVRYEGEVVKLKPGKTAVE
ncbi:MAG: 50S ribosomal protein L6 [Candidatus Pacebacteria bacterium]|nr:50S ribosomal protein L6 [Candidatus Paceibacterota bacterium]